MGRQSRSTGQAAFAFWTSFPESGVPEPNVVYRNIQVFAGDLKFNDDGSTAAVKVVEVNEFRFEFDEQGTLIPVSATNGIESGPVTIFFDPRLRSASVEATLERVTCDDIPPIPELTPRSLLFCSTLPTHDPGPASVSVRWTGSGDLTRVRENGVEAAPCLTRGRHHRLIERTATATASYAGENLGATADAAMFDEVLARHLARHFPHSTHPVCPPPGG